MEREPTVDAETKLDHGKLLGFRNLIPVSQSDSDIRESSDLAFNKRGVETVA
jgi:hypothetical protein